jgi:hypothetical protein
MCPIVSVWNNQETEIEFECANQVGVYMDGKQHDMARQTCVHCAEDLNQWRGKIVLHSIFTKFVDIVDLVLLSLATSYISYVWYVYKHY